MGYGVKYRGEWRATTRGERNYTVDILENGYTGDIVPLYLTGDCVTISYGEVDQGELQPIKSSEAEIHILCTADGEPYTEFFTLDPARYRVEIFEDSNLIWRGYIATGDYQQPLARPPYAVRLRANDGLGILKSMPYLNASGEQWTTTEPVSELFRRLLAPISDDIEIWGYNLITALQTSPTFDLIAIPDNAIYRAIGEEPTYYDVLEAVLSNFAVQLFQNNGAWCIRALSTLANAAMGASPLVPTIQLDSQFGSSLGIKSDATVTFSPPLRKMTYHRDSGVSVNLASVVSKSGNWIQGNDYRAMYNNSVARYGKDAIAITSRNIKGMDVSTQIVSTATLVLGAVIKRSASSKISLTADLFGGDTRGDVTYRIGVWLVNAKDRTTDEVIVWSGRSGNKTVTFPHAAFWWDDEKKVWQRLTDTNSPTYANLGLKEVAFEKIETMGARRALSTLPKSSVTFDIPYIPQIESEVAGEFYENWQVVIVVGSNTCAFSVAYENLPASTLYIANPTISIAHEESLSNGGDSIRISSDGTTDESYDVKWPAGADSNDAAGSFAPGVVEISSGNFPIYGYVEAGCGVAGSSIVGRMLSDMRRRTTRVIEGEVDRALPNGLNTIAKIDGRYYYLTAFTRKLKRGVSSFQLRELPKLTDTAGTISTPSAFISSVIALGDALFWRADKKTYFKRGTDGEIGTIKTSTKSIAYRKGVGCVVVVEYDASTASAEAYDDFGRRIAKIVFEAGVFTTFSITQWTDSITYDATIQAWVAHDKYKVIEMYDSDGYVIATWECPISDTSITDTELLPYNGGFIYKMYSSESGNYYTFWHCYAIHKVGEFEPLSTWAYHSKNVVAVNERFFVVKNSNGAHSVYHRVSGDMRGGFLSSVTSISSTYNIVAINEAMIITRDASGLAVYDFRSTASSKWTYLSKHRNNEYMALCGDIIYTKDPQYVNRYNWQRIFPKLSSLTPSNISMTNEQEANYSRREASNLYQDVTDGGNPVDE